MTEKRKKPTNGGGGQWKPREIGKLAMVRRTAKDETYWLSEVIRGKVMIVRRGQYQIATTAGFGSTQRGTAATEGG